MKKKLFAIVIGLLISSSVFATGKMGVGLGYQVFGDKEGVGADLCGWFLNDYFCATQPIAMCAGSWGAETLPANKQMGVGVGYVLMSNKDPSLFTALIGWWLNAVTGPVTPIAIITGSMGGDDPVYAPKSGKVDISLAE